MSHTYTSHNHNQLNQRNAWEYDLLAKIIIVGDSSVGKSCLLMKYADNEFTTAHQATIGVDFRIATQDVTVHRNGREFESRVKLSIWDTAGQERFRSITAGYYRGAHGLLIVFDKTNEQSFLNIQSWISEIQMHASPNVQIILVGNKCDMKSKIVVDRARAEQLAQELGIAHYVETSAKEGSGVQEAFIRVAQSVAESQNYIAPVTEETNGRFVPDQPMNGAGRSFWSRFC